MTKLKPSQFTYKLTPEELRDMFANELGVPLDRVSIEPETKWIGYGTMEEKVWDGIKVTVKESK